jgi:hypothetical protein
MTEVYAGGDIIARDRLEMDRTNKLVAAAIAGQ